MHRSIHFHPKDCAVVSSQVSRGWTDWIFQCQPGEPCGQRWQSRRGLSLARPPSAFPFHSHFPPDHQQHDWQHLTSECYTSYLTAARMKHMAWGWTAIKTVWRSGNAPVSINEDRLHWVVSNGMGDSLLAGKPSRYLASHPGQLSLAISSHTRWLPMC